MKSQGAEMPVELVTASVVLGTGARTEPLPVDVPLSRFRSLMDKV